VTEFHGYKSNQTIIEERKKCVAKQKEKL